jgi:hypothetical protein
LAIAVRVVEREDRRWQNPCGSGVSPLFGVRVAEREDPQSRALAEFEERVALLEGEGREPSQVG